MVIPAGTPVAVQSAQGTYIDENGEDRNLIETTFLMTLETAVVAENGEVVVNVSVPAPSPVARILRAIRKAKA